MSKWSYFRKYALVRPGYIREDISDAEMTVLSKKGTARRIDLLNITKRYLLGQTATEHRAKAFPFVTNSGLLDRWMHSHQFPRTVENGRDMNREINAPSYCYVQYIGALSLAESDRGLLHYVICIRV